MGDTEKEDWRTVRGGVIVIWPSRNDAQATGRRTLQLVVLADRPSHSKMSGNILIDVYPDTYGSKKFTTYK